MVSLHQVEVDTATVDQKTLAIAIENYHSLADYLVDHHDTYVRDTMEGGSLQCHDIKCQGGESGPEMDRRDAEWWRLSLTLFGLDCRDSRASRGVLFK